MSFASYGVRLRVARSTWMGTCQSLELRNEHQIKLSRFFFLISYSIARDESRRQLYAQMSEYGSSHWETILRRYAVGRQSDFDMSKAVCVLLDRIRRRIPDVEAGFMAEENFLRPPMEYIYVGNKATGPLNIPGEPHRFIALTECELTFWQNHDNTVRFRYFIQLTHGQLIHGVSWVKSSVETLFNSRNFEEVRRYVSDELLKANSSPNTLPKDRYGIYDGRGNRVGTMYNQLVAGFENGDIVMNVKVMAKILSLLNPAYNFFKKNKSTIINLINNKTQQQQ